MRQLWLLVRLIEKSSQLWWLLVQITLLKTRAKLSVHTAEQRDVRAEAFHVEDSARAEIVAQNPVQEEAAVLIDQIEVL